MVGGSGGVRKVCVVGIGGIGKTTLAQIVYNKLKVAVDVGIWISVNQPFSLASVCREIAQKLCDVILPNTDQLDCILDWLSRLVKKKSFFLVLDDVWTERIEDLDPLRVVLSKAAPNTRIIVTTRNEEVPGLLGIPQHHVCQLKRLTDDESWKLLQLVSGQHGDKFKVVGEEIAKKCGGLPLAVMVLGNLLHGKDEPDDWECVLKSNIWNLDRPAHEVFPYLTSSYSQLSLSLKHCFSYIGLYDKGTEVKSQDLIEDWLALGYLGGVKGKGDAEVRGQQYINELVKLSLFQASGNSIQLFGLGHNFALFLKCGSKVGEVKSCSRCVLDSSAISRARDYRSMVMANVPKICDCLLRLRVLRFVPNLQAIPKGLDKLIHLRLLQLTGNDLSGADLKLICRLYFLQTLLLRGCSLQEIPCEIGNLVELRRLDLSKNGLREIPQEVGNLVELRCLDLSDNAALNELPEALKNCEKLQTLCIKRCAISTDEVIRILMPQTLGTSFLQILSTSIVEGESF